MRTIKFRVWNNKIKTWHHGPGETPSLDGINILGENILLGNFLNEISIEDLNEIEVVQYTGIDTKDGTGIYEGDYLKGLPYELPVEVVYENGGFGLKYTNCILYFSEIVLRDRPLNMTVVGNRFENPNLIKELLEKWKKGTPCLH